TYIALIGSCIAHLREDIVIHRLTGDGDKNTLLAPLWSLNKRDVLNSIHKYLKENHIRQGMCCKFD
ncbi:MAG: TIGR01212 family radical SAM protein, partial [Anaerotignum sp.]|nr:TIGR01212 family radical SAM protein [Anaerotignum sp.]